MLVHNGMEALTDSYIRLSSLDGLEVLAAFMLAVLTLLLTLLICHTHRC
jgi:hypothetical protein